MPETHAVSREVRLSGLPPKTRARVIRRLANMEPALPVPPLIDVVTEIPTAPNPIADMITSSAIGGEQICGAVDEFVVGNMFAAAAYTNAFNLPVFNPGTNSVTAINLVAPNPTWSPGDTLLGGHLVSQNVEMGTHGSVNVNKTYQMPPYTPITAALLTHIKKEVENMAGVTANVTSAVQQNTWGVWNGDYCQNVITNQASAWGAWSSGTITIQTTATAGTYIYNPAVLQSTWANWQAPVRRRESENERIAREEREVRAAAAYAEQQKKADEAAKAIKARAEKILVRHLDAEQRRVLAEKGYFDEEVDGKTYRIWRGTHGNIRELSKDKTKEVASLCVQPNGVPTEDAMLAQVLWLRADEKALLRVANRRVLAP